MIQTANQFLIDQMAQESSLTPSTDHFPLVASSSSSALPPNPGSAVDELFDLRLRTLSACSSCGHRSQRDSKKQVIDVLYPPKPLSNEAPPPSDFLSVLGGSIARESISKTLCSACKRVSHLRVKRQFPVDSSSPSATLPPLLSLNAGVKTADHLDLWQDGPQPGQHFLPSSFFVATNTPEVVISDTPDDNSVEYRLKGMILQIQVEGEPAHLVALIDSEAHRFFILEPGRTDYNPQ